MQHTPGPWTYQYSPYTTQDGKDIPAFEIHGEGEKVCDTVEDQPIEAQEANARLIVAAPELLEALQQCERLMRENRRSKKVWLHVCEIIAKAKGG